MTLDQETLVRFWEKVQEHPNTGCWLWRACHSHDGYAKFVANGRLQYAHRVFYEHAVGPVPEGKQLDHLCRQRDCVNPLHLEAVTSTENQRRGTGFAARQYCQTHCKHGHELNENNTYRWRGHRFCRTCRTHTDQRRQMRKRKEHA